MNKRKKNRLQLHPFHLHSLRLLNPIPLYTLYPKRTLFFKKILSTLCLLILLILLSPSARSQTHEFKVISFTHEQNSMLARINENVRKDDNDEACALILVRTAEIGLGFTASSGIVGNVEWKNGDYWVYVSQGNRTIKIFKKGIKTIEYVFDIIPKSKETYLLELEVVRPKPKVPVWPVTIITQPEKATLYIDGQKVETGKTVHKIAEGQHPIKLEMPGYETLEQNITVNDNNVYFNFKLNETLNAALMIESDPPGATVYLDGVKLGETPFSVFYPPGTYPVKVLKDGYVPLENQTLTVTAPQTRKKFALAEDVGYLTINTYETAKVYINGTEYPNHTNLKLPAQVLNIKITMPKAADLEKQVVLKRNDQLSLDLYPEVQTGTLQVAITPFNADIELTGDAGEHYTAQGLHIFRDIPVGEYTLAVKADGYRTETKTITLTANGVLNENIKLGKGPSGDIEMVSRQSGNKSKFPGFKKTQSGLYYKFYKKGNDTTTPKIGQYMDVVMIYGTDDCVLFDSRNLPDLEQMQVPMITSVFPGDIYEGFSMMHVGDSASFKMPADSVWLKLFRMHQAPPGMDSVEYLTFDIKLNEVISADTMRARKEAKQKAALEKEKTERAEYVAKNYPNAKPTANGLYYIRTKKGSGNKPEKGQTVKVNYTGKFLDGTVFDSSVTRGKPIEFVIGQGQVIPGWDEGIAMMRKGEKAVLIIPSNLAYGQGRGKIPPYSTIVFDVELMDIMKNDKGDKK